MFFWYTVYNLFMGILYCVATPIGNLEDITIRAIKILFSVDYIACEDTRKTGQLLKNYELRIKNQETKFDRLNIINKPRLISYYDEIEFKRMLEIIDLLEKGKKVALVSNSGTPLISDPGYKLVSECLKRKIRIVSIPGPSSILVALVSSGLTVNQFLFLGYLPTSQNKRFKLFTNLLSCFKSLSQISPTIIFFESPYRLRESLKDLKQAFGDIEIVIARELTKIHEEIYRGKISQALNYFLSPRGEIVLLFTLCRR